MAMDKASMKTKINDAYTARTGKVLSEGEFNALIDVCQGIIEEILANAEVTVTGVTPGTGAATGSITA